MPDKFSPPSMNSAALFDNAAMAMLILNKYLAGVDNRLPAQVVSVSGNTVKVQPLIIMVTTDNIQVKRAEIAALPIQQSGGGGFVIHVPVKAGDLGWIEANDRDISLFKQSHKASPPNTQRKHSFSDAVFIPDPMNQGITIASEDTNNLVIQNAAGTVKLAFWATFMKMMGSLGIGGSPATGAILDLQSTTQALLLPRMTTAQKNAISSPQRGMMVFDTTANGVSFYNGTWS